VRRCVITTYNDLWTIGVANVRFVIQWNQPVHIADGSFYLPDPELACDPRVQLITGPLDSEAYSARVRAADCMVLPYRRES